MNLKKRIIPLIPYVIIGMFASKLSLCWRLTPGNNLSDRAFSFLKGLPGLLDSPWL